MAPSMADDTGSDSRAGVDGLLPGPVNAAVGWCYCPLPHPTPHPQDVFYRVNLNETIRIFESEQICMNLHEAEKICEDLRANLHVIENGWIWSD